MPRAIPAVFMRGGTSKALMFHARDLPEGREEWTALFAAAMGSPDPFGRQLNGMGGGISSLSKVCVLSPSRRPDADVDYTFAQVMIREERVDYGANCGNMSSAVGPFAVDEGVVTPHGDATTVRIYNTNTDKLIHSTFPVQGSTARYDGALEIPGVPGTGAAVRLDFVDPGGATTGRLLPSGHVTDQLDVPGRADLEVSLVDAGNAVVFVRARDVGLLGTELPDDLAAREEVLTLLERIRRAASVRMGIAPDVERAALVTSVPFICVVGAPLDGPSLAGEVIHADAVDLCARALSNGQPHRALPLTVALCAGVAARITGSVVAQLLSRAPTEVALRIAMPSGVLAVDSRVAHEEGHWVAHIGSFYRTARRLFDGRVWVP